MRKKRGRNLSSVCKAKRTEMGTGDEVELRVRNE